MNLGHAALVLAFATTIGCAGPQPDATPASAQPTVATPVEHAQPAKAEPVKPAPVEPEPEPPKLGRDHRSVVACASDADCGWDDPCLATRCVEAGPARACKDSAPLPGACRCIEGGCTLAPKVAPTPSGTCELRGCMADRAAGRCVADTGGVPENIRSTPGVNIGPSCDCPNPAKGCVFSWFDAVACTSDRDCWIDPAPRRHPVARPKQLRKRDFEPCKDGEVAPVCGPAGTCILGPAYGC